MGEAYQGCPRPANAGSGVFSAAEKTPETFHLRLVVVNSTLLSASRGVDFRQFLGPLDASAPPARDAGPCSRPVFHAGPGEGNGEFSGRAPWARNSVVLIVELRRPLGSVQRRGRARVKMSYDKVL